MTDKMPKEMVEGDKVREVFAAWMNQGSDSPPTNGDLVRHDKIDIELLEHLANYIWQDACASRDAELTEANKRGDYWRDLHQKEAMSNLSYQQQLAAANDKIKVALDKFSHIKWIKDCGIDSSQGNHPEDERDAMYNISCEAITQIEETLK